MDEPYTPTKITPHFDSDESFVKDSPAVYVPSKIVTPKPSTPNKPEETNRQKYGNQGDSHTPTNPGIRIVKRKPKTDDTATSSSPLAKRSTLGDRIERKDSNQAPKKGILRKYVPGPKRASRSIFFADTVGLPLTAVKEIEKIASIHHSKYADFRTFEKNEACVERDQIDEADWQIYGIKGKREKSEQKAVSTQREEDRLASENVIRGSIFGILEDNPELTRVAEADLEKYAPITIPTDNTPERRSSMKEIRDLPLPGRPRPHSEAKKDDFHQPPIQHQYEQVIVGETSNVYQATIDPSPSFTVPPPAIQQIFIENEQSEPQYYISTTEEPKSNIELPDKLKNMLNQLKMKGFVSSENSSSATAPISAAPLAAAMQTAQQMMLNQQLTSSSVYPVAETPDTQREFVNGYNGYIAEFVTPEMLAQERRQDSKHEELVSQSAHKIQENCTYFLNRRDGCNRGDQCRFIHDEDARRQQQAAIRSHAAHNRDQDDRGFRGRRGNYRGGYRSTYQEREFRHDRNERQDRDFRHDRQDRHDRLDRDERLDRNDRQDNFTNLILATTLGDHGLPSFDKPPPPIVQFNAQSDFPSALTGSIPPIDTTINMTAYLQQQEYLASQANEKKKRTSRFDQREEEHTRDSEQRSTRRNRFDEGPSIPPNRHFRSRFDEPPKN